MADIRPDQKLRAGSVVAPSMGYVGWISFLCPTAGLGTPTRVRATSCDIKLTQNITKPDLIDGLADKTGWQLGPQEVGGSVSFPAMHEDGSSVIEGLWRGAIEREATGGAGNLGNMVNIFDIDVKYANGENAMIKYPQCLVDQFQWTATQGDVLNITANVFGIYRQIGTVSDPYSYYQRNSRVVTWNDVTCNIYVQPTDSEDTNLTDLPLLDVLCESKYIRSFSMTVMNSCQRYYSFNNGLTPAFIAPTKRDIDGTMTVIGRQTGITNDADSNSDFCSRNNTAFFGYKLNTGGNGICAASMYVRIPGIVFQIEEMALRNDLFESTITWHALPGISRSPQGNPAGVGPDQGNNTNFLCDDKGAWL